MPAGGCDFVECVFFIEFLSEIGVKRNEFTLRVQEGGREQERERENEKGFCIIGNGILTLFF